MKEITIAAIITLCVGTIIVVAEKRGRQLDAMEQEVIALEREIAARQQMLDDVFHVLPHIRHEVVKIQSELTSYDMMQIIRQIADDAECVVAH